MNQRFKEIADELKNQRKVYTYADLARILDVPRGDLSQMMSGKRKVSKRCVSNLLANFPEINEDWLLTGEGEMLKDTSAIAENHSVSIAGTEIKENKINVNGDKTISMLVAELSAQRQLTEKVIDQNTNLIAIIAEMRKR